MKDETIFLRHILDAINKIEKYTENSDEALFKIDTLVQDAVIRQLEVVGEATKQLSTELRGRYRRIPWQDIAGMRDKLIHHYFGVDIDKVWLTVVEDIPLLKAEIHKIFDELDSE